MNKTTQRPFSINDTQMGRRCVGKLIMKALLITVKMSIKATVREHFTLTRVNTIRIVTETENRKL